MTARPPVLVIYQNDKTGKLATHKQRFRPTEAELRVLVAELEQDTGLLALWIDIEQAQWFIFDRAGIFREQDMQRDRPRRDARPVDPEEIVVTYRTIQQVGFVNAALRAPASRNTSPPAS